MTAKVVGDKLVIEIELNKPLRESQSGKTLVVASTYGNKKIDDCLVDGKPITLGLNAYIPKK